MNNIKIFYTVCLCSAVDAIGPIFIANTVYVKNLYRYFSAKVPLQFLAVNNSLCRCILAF
jgi:hypothetical protein